MKTWPAIAMLASTGLAACSSTPAPAPTTVTTADSAPVLPGVAPVFVVYGAERTSLVPADSNLPVVTAHGLWVLDDGEEGGEPTLRWARLVDGGDVGSDEAPLCPCESPPERTCLIHPNAPLVDLREVDAETGDPSEPDCDCYRVEPRCEEALPAESEAASGRLLCRCAEARAAAESTLEPVALTGGELFLAGRSSNHGCGAGGSTMTMATSVRVRISTGRAPNRRPKNAVEQGSISLEPWTRSSVWPLMYPGCDVESESAPEANDGETSEEHDDAEVVLLRRGRLYFQEARESSLSASRRVWCWPARPETCPSSNDPCGDPSSFPPVVAALASEARAAALAWAEERLRDVEPDGEADFWVASDSSVALLARGRSYQVYLPGQETPLRDLTLDIDARDEAIGVRYHADGRPLLAAMRENRVEPVATRRARCGDVEDEECPTGMICEGGPSEGESAPGWCVPRCRSDADCAARGRCRSFCAGNGSCLDPLDGYCNEQHPCEAPRRCEHSWCSPPQP